MRISDAKDNDGDTPLHWAACREHTEVVELLLERGADINVERWLLAIHRCTWLL